MFPIHQYKLLGFSLHSKMVKAYSSVKIDGLQTYIIYLNESPRNTQEIKGSQYLEKV